MEMVLIILIRFAAVLVMCLYAMLVCAGYPGLAGSVGLAPHSDWFHPLFSAWFLLAFGCCFAVVEALSGRMIRRICRTLMEDGEDGGQPPGGAD